MSRRVRWLGLQGWLIAALIGVGFAASIAVLATVLPTFEQTVRRDRAGEIAREITEQVQRRRPSRLEVHMINWTTMANRLADDTGGQVRITRRGIAQGQSGACCTRLDLFPPIRDYGRAESQLLANGGSLRVTVPWFYGSSFNDENVTVEIAVPMPGGAAELTLVHKRLMFAVAAVFGLAAFAGWVLARFIGVRISRLAVTATRLASGDLAARAPLRGPQELATLGEGLNLMAARIEAQVDAITDERDRARMLISSLTEGVLTVRGSGELGMMNPAAMEFLGVTKDRASMNVGDLPDTLIDAIREASAGDEPVAESQVLIPDGTELSVVIARLAASDGGLVVTLRDVTEQSRLERARRDLVANVSHELKTPLAAIKGLLELLESDGLDAEHRGEFLALMTTEADRLERLVEEQLQLARLDAGAVPLDYDLVDLDALAEGVAQSRRPLAEAAGVEISAATPEDPVTVYVDGARIEQILLILVDNALRHTPSGGSIVIGVTSGPLGARLRVSDTGEGIDAADLPFVFDRFYRGDRSREGRSAGLGLAIARGLATAHGGAIDVTSVRGKGSTFTLHLPPHIVVSDEKTTTPGTGSLAG